MREQQAKKERRKFRRFQIPVGSFSVVRCDSGGIIGELTDISSGGMAFLSDPDGFPLPEYAKIDVLQISDGIFLNNITVRHVSRITDYFEINRQRVKMARSSLGFQSLDSDQKKELGTFIRNHAGN